jgi:hypothetical protein
MKKEKNKNKNKDNNKNEYDEHAIKKYAKKINL